MADLLKNYIAPVASLLAVLLGYFLARRTYFRQKEFEAITRRYLEEGVDAISRNVDRSLGVYRHNWCASTVVLKHFRDLGKDIPKALYEGAFVAPDPSLFEIWRDYRLLDVVGTDVFNRAHQQLDAFVRSSYAFFQNDLATMVRVSVEGGKERSLSRDEVVNGYMEEVKRLGRESERFYVLLAELQRIGAELQSERFTFHSLRGLRHRQAIVESIDKMNQHFPANDIVENGVAGGASKSRDAVA